MRVSNSGWKIVKGDGSLFDILERYRYILVYITSYMTYLKY